MNLERIFFLIENCLPQASRITFDASTPSESAVAPKSLRSKINDPNKRDLYTCGVWVESVSPVADLCSANQLVYQTVQSGTAE